MGAADKAVPNADIPLRWRLVRLFIYRIVFKAARRTLANRTLTDNEGNRLRWLRPEIEQFLTLVDKEAEALRPTACLETLPTFGNRLMVELAVYTAACDRVLRHQGIAPRSARHAVADLGWDIYRRMLALCSLPTRLVSRDPGRRLRWTIRMLLRFPFNAPGVPGYAVDTKVNGEDIFTHFTHCPPQTFVRRLSEDIGDPDALESFRASWCLYDWPGADVIAGDGRRGHYRRRYTLSHGDAVCDMCWLSRARKGRGGSATAATKRQYGELKNKITVLRYALNLRGRTPVALAQRTRQDHKPRARPRGQPLTALGYYSKAFKMS